MGENVLCSNQVPTLQDFLEMPPEEEEEKGKNAKYREGDVAAGTGELKRMSLAHAEHALPKSPLSPGVRRISSLPSMDGLDWGERRSSIEVVDVPIEYLGDGDTADVNGEEDRETGMLENVMIGSAVVDRANITKDIEARGM
jgi:hypothetical protein